MAPPYIGFGSKDKIPPNPNHSSGVTVKPKKPLKFLCYPCSASFDLFIDLVFHNSSKIHKDHLHICNICPNKFKEAVDKKKHMKGVHGEEADGKNEKPAATATATAGKKVKK